MGAIVNAMTIEGLRAFGATFLVFSDYMRGAIRLAAIMEIPSIFVFTHDSVGVGEDGPTHQPVEQVASLRAMPNIEVLRPADAHETILAWRWLLGGASEPAVLALSRQKLPVLDGDAVPEDAIERGAYVLRDSDGQPDLILIGTGSEVSLCLDTADLLAAEGTAVRVVSMPSTTRFAKQEEAYRDAVLPPSVKRRMSVEAGSTFGWDRWVGDEGHSVGIDHFGASAPASAIFEGFGLTPAAVAEPRPPVDRRREAVRFACGFDHGGLPLKDTVLDALRADDHVPMDLGAHELDPNDDYPDFALAVVRAIVAGDAERGILVCGSGAGVAVAATKVEGIRAAMAHDTYTAAQCVEHDNCNVLALGARVIGPEIAGELVGAFANAVFSGEERHVRRLAKVDAIERDGVDARLEPRPDLSGAAERRSRR